MVARAAAAMMLVPALVHAEPEARDGLTFGVRPMTTFTGIHRRDSVELGVGNVWDRSRLVRLSGGPVRAVDTRDVVDGGAELALAVLVMGPRYQLGIQTIALVGIKSFGIGGGVVAVYELVSSDRFAVSLGGRVGAEAYDLLQLHATKPDGGPYVSISLGIDFYQLRRSGQR